MGVLLDGAGRLAEASTSNLFLIRDEALVTPSIEADVFPGITRRSVLEIADRIGAQAVERPVDPDELAEANGFELVLVCGAGLEDVDVSVPVVQVDPERADATVAEALK